MKAAAILLLRSPSRYSHNTSNILHRALLHFGDTVALSSPLPKTTHATSSSSHGLNVSLHNASRLHCHLAPFRTFQYRFSDEASDVSDESSSLVASMEKKIKEQLKADEVTVKDAYGDGSHVSIEVISAAFEGQSSVNRQRMVYKAIWEELQNTVHAVDNMQTITPAEVAKEASNK